MRMGFVPRLACVGDVLVVDLGGGNADGIFFGDISALAAQVQGARGAVLYGSTRDLTELESYERDLVRKKQHRFRDVYPLTPELRKQFEEEKKRKP